MRHLAWVVVVLAAGCRSSGDFAEHPVGAASGPTALNVDPSIYDRPRTSELGTNRTRGVAKTIEWQDISTGLGTAYGGGTVAVDQIRRHDAENFYGVTVRLKNAKNELAKLEWQIVFFSIQGEPLFGFNHKERLDDGWRGVMVDPLGTASVSDSCRIKGAVGYRLFVRKAGAGDQGLPDGFKSGRQP